MTDDFQTELLCIFAFAMMFTDQGFQTFRKTDEAHGQRTLFDNVFQCIFPLQLIGSKPYALSHQEREILYFFLRLDSHTLQQLLDHDIDLFIQFLIESVDIRFTEHDLPMLDTDTRKIDGSK